MYRLLISIVMIIILQQALFAAGAGVRIVKSDRNELTIEYVPGAESLQTVKRGSSEFQKILMKEINPIPSQQTGAPELYVRSLPVQLPGLKGNRVEVVTTEYEDVQNVTLVPVPSFSKSDAGPTPVYVSDSRAYGVNSFIPDTLARLINIGETRGTILGNLLISPFQYNPAAKTLRKITRVVVHLIFGSGGGIGRSDKLVKGIAINEEAFTSAGQTVTGVRSVPALHQSVLSTGTWFSFTITSEGMYKLTGAALLAAGIPASTNPMNIKLYNNGGYELPQDISASYPDDLNEVTIYSVDANSNGLLDTGDYIIFYGKGVRGWTYTPSSKTFSHYINHFTEKNVYWLTVGTTPSKQMAQLPFSTSSANYHPATVLSKLYREDDKINLGSTGLNWLAQQLNVGEAFTYVEQLPGVDVTQPVFYRFTIGAQSKGSSTFQVYEHNDNILTTSSMAPTDVDNYGPYFNPTNPVIESLKHIPDFSDGISKLRFVYSSSNANGYGFIDWYEMFYSRFPQAQGDVFTFSTPDTNAVAQFRIPGYSTNQVYVFDVSRFDSVLVNSQPALSVDTCTFALQLSSGTSREIYCVGKNSFQTVGQIDLISNQNLHGDTTSADEIIITNSLFLPAAERLKEYREQPGTNRLRVLIADINNIYNEFGGGLPSPTAVRNFLRYRYTNWSSPPSYVLMFGDGDFDYRNILSSTTDKIPVWETGIEYNQINSYATDDDFVIFNNALRLNMGIGRIPSQTLADANTVVDKIIEYESQRVNDPWKLVITLVGDDGWTGAGFTDGYGHVADAEALPSYIPPLFETKKIYLPEYPVVFTPNGRRKPTVNAAIRNQVNTGTMVLNFSGHGNPDLWSHEQVFVRETDFPLLTNKGRYFFLVAATCNFSAIDMLNVQSSGELLLLQPNSGAIATYCATRPVYADFNSELNTTLYQYLFQKNTAGYVIPKRFGDVIYQARQNLTDINDRKYVLLGDPAGRIAFPQLQATVDTINGVPISQTAHLRALSNSSLTASVRDANSLPLTGYSGTAQLIVYDADKTVQFTEPDEQYPFTYQTDGNVIFRGEATVDSGRVSTHFIVPKDISYANAYGRITLYMNNSTTDGAGSTRNVLIGGADTTAAIDTEGPAIRLYIDRRTFRSGDVVSATPLLLADLEDEHGINTSGAGVGHLIEAWLDNSTQSIDVTAYYKSNIDTYQQGVVEYPLGALTPGTHKLRLRAWDTYNNPSQTETVFDVVTSVGLQLTSVLNYPNPFSSSTVFSIQHNQYESVDAQIKIYTVAGRLIQSLEAMNVNSQVVNIPWDGRDRDGDQIANGIYLYKAIVKTSDHRLSGEAYGKLSVLK